MPQCLCDFAGDFLATAQFAHGGSHSQQLDDVLIGCRSSRSAKSRSIKAADMSEQAILRAVGVWRVPGLINLSDQPSGRIRWCSLIARQPTWISPRCLRGEISMRLCFSIMIPICSPSPSFGSAWGATRPTLRLSRLKMASAWVLVLNNRLYRGTHGVGLELGHTKVQLDGALCQLWPKRGCLGGLSRGLRFGPRGRNSLLGHEDIQRIKDIDELLDLLFEKAKGRAPACSDDAFRQARGAFLSVGLSNVVQLFDPPLIIISGDRMRFDYFHADPRCLPMKCRRLTLVRVPREPCQSRERTPGAMNSFGPVAQRFPRLWL